MIWKLREHTEVSQTLTKQILKIIVILERRHSSAGNNESDIAHRVTDTFNSRVFKILSIKQITNF